MLQVLGYFIYCIVMLLWLAALFIIPGALVGFLVINALRRTGILDWLYDRYLYVKWWSL